jgi:hypothetical protein
MLETGAVCLANVTDASLGLRWAPRSEGSLRWQARVRETPPGWLARSLTVLWRFGMTTLGRQGVASLISDNRGRRSARPTTDIAARPRYNSADRLASEPLPARRGCIGSPAGGFHPALWRRSVTVVVPCNLLQACRQLLWTTGGCHDGCLTRTRLKILPGRGILSSSKTGAYWFRLMV